MRKPKKKITPLFQIIDKILAPFKSVGVLPLIWWGTDLRMDFETNGLETATFLISHISQWKLKKDVLNIEAI